MSENRARYPIAVMCRVLDVSSSGYYAWVKRPPSAHAVTDAALIVEIRAAHAASKGTYGAPRLQIDLADAGIRVRYPDPKPHLSTKSGQVQFKRCNVVLPPVARPNFRDVRGQWSPLLDLMRGISNRLRSTRCRGHAIGPQS